MKRSNIAQEKIPNSANLMNHAVDDDDKWELIKTLSIESCFDDDSDLLLLSDRSFCVLKLEADNHRDHVYENIRKKNSLSEIIAKYTKLLKTKLSENSLPDADSQITYRTMNMKYQESDEDFSSYMSCLDENIYENLNFNYENNWWRESETITMNESTREWLETILCETEDYESTDFMINKCIPSYTKSSVCSYDVDVEYYPEKNMNQTQTDLALEKYKLDILKKCWAFIRSEKTESDTLNSLYLFLNEIFSTYFKRPTAHTTESQNIEEMKVNDNDIPNDIKHPTNTYEVSVCKSVDKKIIQKLETFILSVTLNRLTITYNETLKFYFALESSETFKYRGVSSHKDILKIAHHFYYILNTSVKKNFIKTLRLLLFNKEKTPNTLKNAIEHEIDDVKVVEEIYHPIWNWRTDCRCENIYDTLDSLVESDDKLWEIDSEFSFVNVKPPKDFASHDPNQNMYKTVCILYSDDNPELNNIIYSYNSSTVVAGDYAERITRLSENENLLKSLHLTQRSMTTQVDTEADSVTAWKSLLRQPGYIEDEEDLIMSETQIAALKFIQTNNDNASVTSFEKTHDVKEDSPKNKLISISNGSYELKPSVSELSIESSLHGSYRNINVNESKVLQEPVEIMGEPKKERERFRDKVKVAFKLKSSKTSIAQESVDAVKEVEERLDLFGSNIDLVEKDQEHKFVPKLVVECVSILENDPNIKTPGLYRISGNKTLIESIKKKINDKKSSKKSSLLQIQDDVHCISGILKMFFRELSPPLMSTLIFSKCSSDNLTSEQLGSILREMPSSNFETLKYLVGHLKRVEQHKDENLMTAANLAICWGLCIFSSSFDSSNQFFENDISKCNVLCKRLIDQYGEIFLKSV